MDLLASNCAVVDMLISDNGGSGISLGFGTTVRDCSVSGNGLDGVRSVGAACVFLRCAAHSNSGTGIVSGFGATVSECTVYGNTGNGISANGSVIGGCTISHCTAFGNRLDGIIVSASCLVLANTCTSNGTTPGDGAGIHATGGDNRIEGNNCVGNDRGIDIDGNRNRVDGNSVNSNTVGFAITGVNNIVIRNTASSNPSGNYSIIAGNSVAPRVAVTASDGWAGITNANHPWANFGY